MCNNFKKQKNYQEKQKNSQKSQTILERKLCHCFGQLLFIYWKNVGDGIEYDIDSAYGVFAYIRHSWNLVHTLQFKRMMNLTVC